jgi:hypothetical protein
LPDLSAHMLHFSKLVVPIFPAEPLSPHYIQWMTPRARPLHLGPPRGQSSQ